jgi:hypothetical protein
LDSQFIDIQTFRVALETLLRLRMKNSLLRDNLYCSRALHLRPVTRSANFQHAVNSLADRNLKQLVLSWITRQGPFWEDDRQSTPEDYFEYQGEDVTDQGLGEAARRQLAGTESWSFSFTGSRFGFTASPLQIQHGIVEDPQGFVEIGNIWKVSDLEQAAQSALPEPGNWKEAIETARQQFDGLVFASAIETVLQPEPFSRYVVVRIFELLDVLNQLAIESDEHGKFSAKADELYQNHFTGEKGWFTDESETNKNKFRQQLTFPDPTDPNNYLFSPWHGKIKSPQFRIHFEWLRPSGQRKIKVLYIGSKITKR